MKKGPRNDDVEYDISDIAALTNGYNHCDDQYKYHKAQMDEWKQGRDKMQQSITEVMDMHGANVASIDGKPVCRWTHYTVDEFQVDRFREKEPELAEQYTVQKPRTRFTPYRNFGKKKDDDQKENTAPEGLE
jgi:hypothetical protein